MVVEWTVVMVVRGECTTPYKKGGGMSGRGDVWGNMSEGEMSYTLLIRSPHPVK